MGRILALLYGVICHLMFLAVFLYLIAFLGNLDIAGLVPKTIDSGMPGPLSTALIINVALLAAFLVPHSVMARPGFKRWWTQTVPKPVERSTYVLFSNLLLILMMWQWRPMTDVIWEVQHPIGANVLWGLFALGFGIVVVASLIIDHFDLFGTRQVTLYAKGVQYTPLTFKVVGFYKIVRHPILLGWMVAFWSTPRMTLGHLVFALATTTYMLIAIRFEERDLATFHGEPYKEYQQSVPALIPGLGGK